MPLAHAVEGGMRRRLRKKMRLGEFTELGFAVVADLKAGLSAAEINAFVDRWIDAVEAHGLAFGGGCGAGDKLEGFVTLMARGSPSERERQALIAFLDGEAVVIGHDVGELRDARRA
jgi:uncharacterized protein YggL (DUF469 family)